MAKQDAKDDLSIKVSHADMLAYTDQIYTDIADPAINGINTHAADESPHNLPARFAAVQTQIDNINDELATKLGTGDISLDGKADVIGDTFTGTVIFAGGDEKVVLQGPEQTDRSIIAKTGTTNRWELGVASNDDEQGANSGSNFVVARFADDGNFLGIPFAIDRATGVTYVDQLQVGGGNIIVGEGLDVRLQDQEPTTNLKLGTVWLRPTAPPGGPPLANIPTTGLRAHIAASSITGLTSGQQISSVPDLSPNGNSASAVGSPVYLTNQTPSGQPAMRGGNPGHLMLPAGTMTGATAGHLFCYVAEVEYGEKSGPYFMGAARTQHWDSTIEEGAFRQYGTGYTPAPAHKFNWRIMEVSASNPTQYVYIDGALQATGPTNFYVSQPWLLRSSENVGAGSGFLVADFLLYDRILTTQEAADVRQALIEKNGPTGPMPVEDPQYAAVMALSPQFYLPLTANYNDYSGGNNNFTYSRGTSSIGRIPFSAQGPSTFGHIEPSTSYTNHSLNGTIPTFSYDFSFSWWATRAIYNNAGWSSFSHSFGSGAVTITQNSTHIVVNYGGVDRNYPLATNRSIMDHYCVTTENNTGYPTRLYINGSEVANWGLMPAFTFSGPTSLFQKGTGDVNGNQYGSHFAMWDRQLTPAEIVGLSNARRPAVLT